MGFIGGLIGGAVGAVGGFMVGGPAGAIAGATVGYELGDEVDFSGSLTPTGPQYPAAPDYSDAMLAASENNKTIALAQIGAQMFALQQGSSDRDMQRAMNLELGLEKLDTKLQVAKLEFVQQMTAEENHFREKMAELEVVRAKKTTQASSGDFPEPNFDFFV